MNAVRLARAFTGRPKLAKFEGAFHGTHDWVMVSVSGDTKSWGNRRRPKPIAWSAGIPPAVLKNTVVLPWNDPEACEEILTKEGATIAAVIVDPYMCNARTAAAGGRLPAAAARGDRAPRDRADLGRGDLVPHRVGRRPGKIGRAARPHRRSARSSAAACRSAPSADGATSWPSTILARAARRISQGGTFNANPVTMAAGVATLNALTPEAYTRLEALTQRLSGGVSRSAHQHAAARAGLGRGLAVLAALDDRDADRLSLHPDQGHRDATAGLHGPAQRGHPADAARASGRARWR